MKKSNVPYVTIVSVIAIVTVVVALIFFFTPFSNKDNTGSSTDLMLSGFYKASNGASFEFIDESNVIMGSGDPVNDNEFKAFSGLTYVLEGNQITFYTAITQGQDKVPQLFGYGTVNNDVHEIVFYGDIYTKNNSVDQ